MPANVRGLTRLQRVWDEALSDATIHYGGFLKWRSELAEAGSGDLRGLRVLDIGCGDRAPLSLLLALEGARVHAIDLLPVRLGAHRPLMWVQMLRDSDWRGAARQTARDALHTWRYWRHLRRLAGRALPFGAVRFQQMDAQRLRFADGSFDLVISSAVWEHLPDVRRATIDVNRVLKPGGLAIIQVALFPALQGGHHPEWHTVRAGIRRAVRAWDHVLPGSRPLPLYCNGWREAQYRQVFEELTEVARWEGADFEGSEYLTDELRRELAGYSERDLLMPYVTIWAKKRVPRQLVYNGSGGVPGERSSPVPDSHRPPWSEAGTLADGFEDQPRSGTAVERVEVDARRTPL